MVTEIGITAGEIWHYLDQHGQAGLDEVVTGTGQPRELVLMSLGWLAREGHVTVRKEGNAYRVNLNSRS